MKVNLKNHIRNRDIVSFAIIAAIVKKGEDASNILPDSDGCVDIVFQVNGIDLNFEDALNRFRDNLKEAINKEAHKIVKSKAHTLYDTFQYLQDAIKNKTLELFPSEDD